MSRARGALALALLVLVLAVPGVLPGTARAAPSEPGGPAVSLAVSDLRPRAPRPGDVLQIVGMVTNRQDTALRDVQVRVGVGSRLSSRLALRQADGQPHDYRPAGSTDLPDLPAGAALPVDVRVPVDDLQLHADGVYPLQVEVRGRQGDSSLRTQVGVVATYLPWFGDRTVDPLRVAWLWPLVDVPHAGLDDVLLDDTLARSLGRTGRVGRSLQASRAAEGGSCPTPAPPRDDGRAEPRCSAVPVTYAVDPALLTDAALMTRPYQVQARGRRAVAGTGQPQATAWLASLREATAAGNVLALPYADPDVVALTRGSAPLGADVAAARTYGVTVTREALGIDPVETVAFPPPGALTDPAFDVLTTPSTRAVVLEDDVLTPPPPGATSTPGTRVALPASSTSGPLTGLVVDRGLSDLLVPDRAGWQGARLAEQRWLVETAMISAELPRRGRTLLVATPRRAAVDPALLAGTLTDTGAVPWMCPVPVADLAAAHERCPAAPVPSYEPSRTAELVQPAPGAPELDEPDVVALAAVQASADQLLGAVLRGGTEQAQSARARLQRGEFRAQSSAWRDARTPGARLTGLLRDEVARLRDRVRVLAGRVTLTSGNGRVSVGVVNELDQPVTLAVRLEAPAQARLSTTSTGLLDLGPRSVTPVNVQARTLTSGRFVVRAQLVDRNGRDFGDPAELIVRSTRYGTAALAVTGVGAAVLFLAAGFRLVRRALGSRPAAP